ncbi:kinesin-like protein Klp61F [Ptiloglossa arizonensis]|uniref:kinesin-like protein Klp61F n=1 Tax=Ptiloglossa arizonensis TaxID=3350558 RepID=UPI003F9F2989
MSDTRIWKKSKSQHIQVFVRVRPINNAEQNSNSTTIIEVPSDTEVIVHERPKEKFSKKFKFDNVFGPSSKQVDVYNAVVSPLLEQVLAGYNCTVFAYGQTGTGKTFTMEGINTDSTLHWQSDSTAGMIPRSLSHLFDELQLLEAQEFTIRVSFLELYNEELFNLLSANDDGCKIRLYEDTSKKGAVIIHGLEEVTIHNKNEVYKCLEKGLERRQTAPTLMNANSSRSHTIFSITIHMKENTIDGEEVLKTGKLNLVDLAGSENVGRSGSSDRRAREAGYVNQSLLTLGRVITALVERAPHIPYRESKLTRLLQESLGGRTKTSIIATISPASINLEETLSTLDYAHRAKNITNRPEINQKLSKREFLKQYTTEIERLRRDLLATRERNGVYVANDNYNEMQILISQQTKEIEEKINNIKALEKIIQDKEKIFEELKLQNIAQKKELDTVKVKLDNTTDALKSTHYQLNITTKERDEQRYLVEKHVNTEQVLLSQGQTLLNVVDIATEDFHKLHEKIARKTEAEKNFEILGEQFKTNVCKCIQGSETDIREYEENLKQFYTSMKTNIDTETVTRYENINREIHRTSTNLIDQHSAITNNLITNINEFSSNYQNWVKDEMKGTVDAVDREDEFLSSIAMKSTQNINGIIEDEIANKLQLLKNSLLQKIRETSTKLNEVIDSVCNRELEACKCINKNVKTIERNVEEIYKKQEFTEKQRLFAKMMKDVSVQFDLLNKSETEHYALVTNKCTHIGEICNKINDYSTDACNANVKMKNNLREQIQNYLEKIETNVVIGSKENEELANNTTKHGKSLANELKSSISTSCNILKQYKNLVENNTKEVQQNIDSDKNEVLSLLKNTHKLVIDANKNYVDVLKDEEIKDSNISDDVSYKLQNLIAESLACCNKNIGQLHTTMQEVNQFFDVEIQHDIPTGTTPIKKKFSYPRQFTVTSPHERILQKFRKTNKFVETLEDDNTYMESEITMKQIANSTALSDVTSMSSPFDNTIYTSLTSNNDLLSKNLNLCIPMDSHTENISSTLDISLISAQSHVSLESKDTQEEI